MTLGKLHDLPEPPFPHPTGALGELRGGLVAAPSWRRDPAHIGPNAALVTIRKDLSWLLPWSPGSPSPLAWSRSAHSSHLSRLTLARAPLPPAAAPRRARVRLGPPSDSPSSRLTAQAQLPKSPPVRGHALRRPPGTRCCHRGSPCDVLTSSETSRTGLTSDSGLCPQPRPD